MNKQLKKMIQKAQIVRKNAYTPHSKFKVGSAVLGKSGKIYTGCNVENASFGITICAERVAIAQAIAQGEKEIKTIVIIADTYSLTPPCGACRQFIHEFGPKSTVILTNLKHNIEIYNIEQLLPHPFDISLIKKDKSK